MFDDVVNGIVGDGRDVLEQENDGQRCGFLPAVASARLAMLLHCTSAMKTLLLLALAVAVSAPVRADDNTDATKVVNSFYATYIAAINKAQDGDKVVQKSSQLSPAFKKAYAELMAKARKKDPEAGLGYDPIICGQDYPDAGFAVTSITLKETTGSAVVSSKDKSFKHSIPLKLVKLDGKWLINGIEKLQGN
jgi:hypothetical protein